MHLRRGNVKGEARCVHFHGPKPDRCLPCYLNVARLNPVRLPDTDSSFPSHAVLSYLISNTMPRNMLTLPFLIRDFELP